MALVVSVISGSTFQPLALISLINPRYFYVFLMDFIWGIYVIKVCKFYELYCESLVGFLWWFYIVWVVTNA